MMLFWIILVSICHLSHSESTYQNNNNNEYNSDEWVPVDNSNSNSYTPSYTPSQSTYGNEYNQNNKYNNGYNNGNPYYNQPPPTPSPACNISLLVNGDFETPVNAQQQPLNSLQNYYEYPATRTGWMTTDPLQQVEIWNAPGFTGVGGLEPTRMAYSGNQWNELNANAVDTIYQVVDTTMYQGLALTWQFAHRGRLGVDTMQLLIGAGPTLANPPMQPVVAQETDGPAAWVLHTGTYIVPTGQTSTLFALKSVSASGNIPTYGNFIDFVSFNYTCPQTPEPPCKSARLSYCARRCRPCLKDNYPSYCSVYKNIQRPDHSLYLREQDDDCVLIENVEYNDITIGTKDSSCHICVHVKNAKISGDFTLKHPAQYTASMRNCHVQGNINANDDDIECIHGVQVDGNGNR